MDLRVPLVFRNPGFVAIGTLKFAHHAMLRIVSGLRD
jgi:hypothetical protein